MTINLRLHEGDLPADLVLGPLVAVDTETMGLNPHRDRLCVAQLTSGDGVSHLVQFPVGSSYEAPNLSAILGDPNVTKIFHFARFDIAFLYTYLGVLCRPVFCTKVAAKLVRTYTDRHGLKDLCRDLLGVDLSKELQQSDWGAENLSDGQRSYAGQDVEYLHRLKEKLDHLLAREGRTDLAEACFEFLPTRSLLDLGGWNSPDILSH